MSEAHLFESSGRRLLVCAVAAVVVISSGTVGWFWKQRKKTTLSSSVAASKQDSERRGEVDSVQRAYVHELASFLNIPEPAGVSPAEMLALTANLHLRVNQNAPVDFNSRMYPWLNAVPPTLATSELNGTRSVSLDLSRGELVLPEPFTHYQYSIRNTGTRVASAPLLYQDMRWDEVDGLLATTGLATITDELDRAIAVWRFICEHRIHFWPPTEGNEEHDLIKFLSVYGYGFCDDSARAVAMLAELVGLQSRVRFLHGDVHVVAEIFAGGQWRMFDADQMVYFHAPGAPDRVLGVEELVRDAQLFENAVWIGKKRNYDKQYVRAFTYPNGRHMIKPTDASAVHRIAFRLMPGERVVFGNFNWGRYFLGKYPHRVPRYLNGFIERPLRADSFAELPAGVRAEADTDGFILRNGSDHQEEAKLKFEVPFPIVGGRIVGAVLDGTGQSAEIQLEDREHRTIQRHILRGELSLNSLVSLVAKKPTTRWTLGFTIPANGELRFRDCRIFCDFQFAEFSLIRFQPGFNSFRVHWPEGETKDWNTEIQFR